jgi:hypothetical protein
MEVWNPRIRPKTGDLTNSIYDDKPTHSSSVQMTDEMQVQFELFARMRIVGMVDLSESGHAGLYFGAISKAGCLASDDFDDLGTFGSRTYKEHLPFHDIEKLR